MNALVVLLKILITFALSFAFGMQRQKAHKPLGFGTYTFVAIGACGLAIVASDMESPHLMAAIITGIGFLGAGALIKTGEKLMGAVSAASIWLFASLGLIIGVGEYFLAAIIYLLIWSILIFDARLEKTGVGSYQRRMTLVANKVIGEKELKSIFAIHTQSHKMISVHIEKKNSKVTIKYLIEGSRDSINRMVKEIYKEPWLEECKVE
ncbi:MgtC/SapB family protein [Candidatus Woesearchaeota archaeon]|nr:MgtC/SapB family protein [Candidatus Woesearchaeota archaeon]